MPAALLASLGTPLASEADTETLHFGLVQEPIFVFVHPIKESTHLLGDLGSTNFPVLILVVTHWVKATAFSLGPALAATGKTATRRRPHATLARATFAARA